MRINGKFYGDAAKKAAVDKLWANADATTGFHMPDAVRDEFGTVAPARAFFDTQAIGCGWTPDGRVAGAVASYMRADAAALSMAYRMLLAWAAYDSQDGDEARTRAALKAQALIRPVLAVPKDACRARDLAREFREADHAFWKWALTRS